MIKFSLHFYLDDRPPRERILSVVCPLSDKSYEKQLQIKTNKVEEILKTLRQNFMKQNAFFSSHDIQENELAVLEKFIPSPEVNEYRNKCEFTIGKDYFLQMINFECLKNVLFIIISPNAFIGP